VPEVDPEDLKTVWRFFKPQIGGHAPRVGFERLLKRLCKPGADLQALRYRAWMMSLVAMIIQTQQLAPDEAGTLDMKVFTAMAKIPLEWMGEEEVTADGAVHSATANRRLSFRIPA